MADKTEFEQLNRFLNVLNECLECGNCTFWCPVYDIQPSESSVARGKNVIIKKVLKGKVEYTDEDFDNALSACTLCMACTEHCPVECDVKSIIIAARADKVKAKGLDRKLISNSGYYRTGRFLAAKSDSGPRVTSDRFLRNVVPLVSSPPKDVETKMRVGFFVGCTTNFLFPELGERIIRFLTRNGVEVVVPRDQGCCGSPSMLRVGDFETARKRADINVEAFENLDYVMRGCPICASTMKSYVKYLANTPKREEGYARLATKVGEIIGFLVDKMGLPTSAYKTSSVFKDKSVTWHDPCHLARHLGVRDQPRQILRGLQDMRYVEMVRPDWCCGMAGTFSERQGQISTKIADKKIETVRDTGADIVVTSCPGCILQLTDAVERHGMPQKVMHIIELLE